jgi:hypothetical protein
MKWRSIIFVLCLWMVHIHLTAQENPSKNLTNMYLERNVFHLKFGASKDAVPMWKEYLKKVRLRDDQVRARLLTDVSGPAYTLVLELTYQTFAEAEPSVCRLTNQPDWKEFYQKFIPLCEHAERTYYRIQDF